MNKKTGVFLMRNAGSGSPDWNQKQIISERKRHLFPKTFGIMRDDVLY
ncbi:hypothetical protein [Trichococcus patagoniensis]|nr:hypothetical protein [Trichococcus patagoniensis]